MNRCLYSCYNILSFTRRWMPLHCCHFRDECFHVPRVENDDIPPCSNDNIWNPGHGESWGKRLSRLAAIVSQPLSRRERAKCQNIWCLAACHSVSDSCQRCPRTGEESRRGEDDGRRCLWGELPCRNRGRWRVGWQNTCLSTQYLLETHARRARK